jgi:predicted PurR-regulated permease PerM
VQTGVFVLALFFLLAEGHRLVDYLVDLAPLDDRRVRGMLASFREVAVGVLLSALVTAVVQTAAAAIGYLIAGVPAVALVLLITFVCSFIPSIGGAVVTVGTGALLWMSGRPGMGMFLIAWGLAVVSTIDNIVKPWVAKGHTKLPASVVFFAMICGLAAFGPLGLVAGPLIAAFFHVVAKMLRDDRAQGAVPARKSSSSNAA